MNLKRTFGAILTILGIAGLIYTGYLGLNSSGGAGNTRELIIFGVLGVVFFSSGIGLVKSTGDREERL